MSSNTNEVSSGTAPPMLTRLVNDLRHEVEQVAATGWDTFRSLAWLWPLQGIFFTLRNTQVILSVRGALMKSMGSSAIVFAVLAFFTYVPQAALLSLFTGFLGPILAIFLLGAESIMLLTFLAKPLFLEPALQHVFDATLTRRGQTELVKNGKTKNSAFANSSSALVRPLQALSQDGIVRYILTLPLNLVPVLGTALFVCVNGYRAGPSWHARYFQLKSFDKAQRTAFVERHRAEYTAFGVSSLVLSFIPIIGLVFTFTNTVGAALWAADMEARGNIIEGQSEAEPGTSAKAKSD